MSDGIFLLAMIFALTLGTTCLACLAYLLYRFGSGMANRYLHARHVWAPMGVFAALALVCSMSVVVLLSDPFSRFCFGSMIWLTLVQPTVIGYSVTRRALLRKNQEDRWNRTDQWLGDWENAHRK